VWKRRLIEAAGIVRFGSDRHRSGETTAVLRLTNKECAMRKVLCALTVVALTLLVLAPAMGAEEPKAGQPVRPVIQYQPGPMYYGLPGYYMLQQENVQKEIELVPEQKAKLQEIAKKYYEGMQEDAKIDWAKVRELPAEEQKKKYEEIQQAYTKRAADVKKQVEDVLLPHQLQTLKKLENRTRAASLLYMPNVLEKIGVTEEQKKKMQQVREDIQKKMAQLQQETLDKTLEVLTPEQRKKLDEAAEEMYKGWGQPGAQR
jgi:Spy/CpxP family protein refolding chaperone